MEFKTRFFSHMRLLLLLPFLVGFSTNTQYHKTLWLKWSRYSPLSTEKIDHQPLEDFLKTYLVKEKNGLNLINYYHVSTEDKEKLIRYIQRLSQTDITKYNRNEQLAFWLNLYNTLMICTILEHFPVERVDEITLSSPLLAKGPWQANITKVLNNSLSLYDIKNRIVRPIWNDPRVLYAFFEGSVGGPNLQETPFQGVNINQTLNDITHRYINSLRGVLIQDHKLSVSRVFDWYEEDFGGRQQDVIWHITQYANPDLKEKLKKLKKIDNYVYNWHLNSTYR